MFRSNINPILCFIFHYLGRGGREGITEDDPSLVQLGSHHKYTRASLRHVLGNLNVTLNLIRSYLGPLRGYSGLVDAAEHLL